MAKVNVCRCGAVINSHRHLMCTRCRKLEEEKGKIKPEVIRLANEERPCPPHFWILDTPVAGRVKHTCKKCEEMKWVTEHYWLDSDIGERVPTKKSA